MLSSSLYLLIVILQVIWKKINGNIPQIKETMKNNDLPLKTNFFYLSQTSPDIIEQKIIIMIDIESLSPLI